MGRSLAPLVNGSEQRKTLILMQHPSCRHLVCVSCSSDFVGSGCRLCPNFLRALLEDIQNGSLNEKRFAPMLGVCTSILYMFRIG